MTILNEFSRGYTYAGDLTDGEKVTIDNFYVYQECGTPISDNMVDNTPRQWAYMKWSKHE
jgi:hypothetical protein